MLSEYTMPIKYASKKKDHSKAIGAAGAGVGLGAGVASVKSPKMGPKYDNVKKLLAQAKHGDIIMRGRVSYRDEIEPVKQKTGRFKRIRNVGDRTFWGSLKPATGSYAPHGGIITAKGKQRKDVYHAIMPNVQRDSLKNFVKNQDRIALYRPKVKESVKDLAVTSGKLKHVYEAPYPAGKAVRHGWQRMVFPKVVRDLTTKKPKSSDFAGGHCSGFVGGCYDDAKGNLVGRRADTAMPIEIQTSKKVKPIGWAGSPVTKTEKLTVKYLPKAIKGLVGALAVGGAAYGISKLVSNQNKKKK